ncbi:LacI family DNA-binding transcriptional regulator [Stappia indica]|uniref:Substrate-binding domain-containing protein n=1 Tax=Stappia indica TaxID=538381 RepID=A0A857C6J1_9HYPH|nr:LacI family DNA-binding transcriptional regulator [Stappia indica]QGZ34590.1 substrate-binding domain-containing protein [Stappia indica]
MKIRPPTIKDVAERAACGIATASRVLNGRGPASEKTRKKVLAAAADLGFEFSDLGRSLQSSTTRTIGCVVPSLANPVFADVVQAAQAQANRAGYQLILACSDYDTELESRAIRTLLAKQVDGLIVTVSNVDESEGLEQVRARGVPCALVYNRSCGDLPAWTVDNRAAAAAVAREFAARGHRHTGFLALEFGRSDRSRERFEGFAEACAALGMAPPVLLEIAEQEGQLLELLRALLSANRDVTGIFASNDYLALAAMKAARGLGMRIPQDLSIVGFDGISTGLMVEPNLATVVTDPRAMGEGAARTVLAQLAGETPPAGPDPARTFSFRQGGSLGPPAPGSTDGGEAATSPPSRQ